MQIEDIFPEHKEHIYQLAPEVRTIWGLQLMTGSVLVSIILFVVDLLWLPVHLLFVGFPAAVTLFGGLLGAMLLPSLYYRRWRFLILESDIVIQRGIIVQTITFVPLARVQHIEISRSLWERLFALATLVIFTAGTRKADVRIPGLDTSFALSLRDYIRSRLTASDVL